MTLNYKEKGNGLHKAIRKAGYEFAWVKGRLKYKPQDELAIQAIIDNYDPINDYKFLKKSHIKKEAVKRSGDYIAFPRSLYAMLKDATSADSLEAAKVAYDFLVVLKNNNDARQAGAAKPDPQWDGALAVVDAARRAMKDVDALSTTSLVASYNVKTDPEWP